MQVELTMMKHFFFYTVNFGQIDWMKIYILKKIETSLHTAFFSE